MGSQSARDQIKKRIESHTNIDPERASEARTGARATAALIGQLRRIKAECDLCTAPAIGFRRRFGRLTMRCARHAHDLAASPLARRQAQLDASAR